MRLLLLQYSSKEKVIVTYYVDYWDLGQMIISHVKIIDLTISLFQRLQKGIKAIALGY